MTTSPSLLIASVAVVAALVFSACGTSEGSSAAPQEETTRQADLTRTTLIGAEEAARAYGQAQLGHFLEMGTRDLEREGLELADDLSLEIRADHTGFCIEATNEALPSIHPWARGSISSSTRIPSTTDRCQI